VGLERWAGVLEGRMLYVLGALLVACALVFSGLRWGVPATAKLVAGVLPDAMAQMVDDQTLQVFEQVWLAPSGLPKQRQQALAQQLQTLCARTSCPPYKLLFRQGKRIGANAMALPGGTVVVTDELVLLARHDEEILAVLSHELGHVQLKHGLRMALQSLGAGVILVAITGDVGSVSDVAAGLPAVLMQTGYSRSMEREADDFALHWLQSACVSPQRFADILQRLDTRPGETGMLDSHPGTAERIRQFNAASACS
jgi:Zn-dependent protease with chaperone function